MEIDEIVDGLFIGGIGPALASFPGKIICVIEDQSLTGNCRDRCVECCPEWLGQPEVWIPLLDQEERANKSQLDLIASSIELLLQRGNKVLVHCGAGKERSPLAVAWYLHTKRGMTLDDAYAVIRRARNTWDRQNWIRDLQGYES